MTTSVRFGAELHRGGVTFRLWAPAAKRVEVMVDRPYPMEAQAAGWYELTIPGGRDCTLYKYRIDGEIGVDALGSLHLSSTCAERSLSVTAPLRSTGCAVARHGTPHAR